MKKVYTIILFGFLTLIVFYNNLPLNQRMFRLSNVENGADTMNEMLKVRVQSDLLIIQHLQQFKNIINGKLNKIAINDSKLVEGAKADIFELYNIILSEVLNMKQIDDDKHWLEMKLMNLTQRIQKRIYSIQFPPDCDKAKKLNCPLRSAGLGSLLHQIVYCLIAGYSINRVVLPILELKHFSSRNSYQTLSWNDLFLPITNCSVRKNADLNETDDIFYAKWYNIKLATLPPAIPEEFAEDLQLHSNPSLFWISQFVNFTMRYSPSLHRHIEKRIENLHFKNPLVGVHVRRTDKINKEAYSFEIEEYMAHVSNWYNLHKCKTCTGGEKRRVYLASDEPKVVAEALLKYPDYEFFFDVESKVTNISSSSVDVITSIHILSRCDFIVCTFSSNICLLAYELMQLLNNGDVPEKAVSLDTNYWFFGEKRRQQIAILDHKPDKCNVSEIELKINDVLNIKERHKKARNRFDGYKTGKNIRTSKVGRYPSYKVKDKLMVMKFPINTDVQET